MTVREIISKALTLLGYFDASGKPDVPSHSVMGIAAVNAIYAELFYTLFEKGFKTIANLDDIVDLPERLLNDCIHYGVAMLLAQSEDDGDSQQLYADIFNSKLSAANTVTTMPDTFVKVGE